MQDGFDPTFTTGNWYTYSLVEYSGPAFITAGHITQAMKVFRQHHKVTLNVVSDSQLLFWTLTLQTERAPPVTRSASRRREPLKILTHVYKFAISSDEKLLFSNRLLPVKMQRQLSKSFSCNNFKLLKLKDSDPANLLMMYQQSTNKAPDLLKLHHEEYLASLEDQMQYCGLTLSNNLVEEEEAAAENKAFKTLGSKNDMIPCIRHVTLSVHDVPAAQNSGMLNFRWSHAEADISCSSVFHLYKELVEMKLVESVPLWLEKIRTSGKTCAEARYA